MPCYLWLMKELSWNLQEEYPDSFQRIVGCKSRVSVFPSVLRKCVWWWWGMRITIYKKATKTLYQSTLAHQPDIWWRKKDSLFNFLGICKNNYIKTQPKKKNLVLKPTWKWTYFFHEKKDWAFKEIFFPRTFAW